MVLLNGYDVQANINNKVRYCCFNQVTIYANHIGIRHKNKLN
ncbi:hypothetical protein MIDIC_470011 [Alphaproteobacteria bacterium]